MDTLAMNDIHDDELLMSTVAQGHDVKLYSHLRQPVYARC